MLASVQFDNDQGFYTGKITNVDAYRMLPAKLEPGELSSAQMTPKQAFGVGWTLAKSAREAKHLRIGSHSLGISTAKYNRSDHVVLTPPALRATSPRKRGEERRARAQPRISPPTASPRPPSSRRCGAAGASPSSFRRWHRDRAGCRDCCPGPAARRCGCRRR